MITWAANGKCHQTWELELEDEDNANLALVAPLQRDIDECSASNGRINDSEAVTATRVGDEIEPTAASSTVISEGGAARCRILSRMTGLALGIEAVGDIAEGAPVIMAPTIMTNTTPLQEDEMSCSEANEDEDATVRYFCTWVVVPLRGGC